jgi:Ca-activated chloride channel family protein
MRKTTPLTALLTLALGLALISGCGLMSSDEATPISIPGADAGVAQDGAYWPPPGSADAGGAWTPDPTQDPSKQPKPGDLIENDFIETSKETTSTFGIDVDTASYTLARAEINAGRLPDKDTVRVEEFLNYFEYSYPQPGDPAVAPFSVNLELAPSLFGDTGAQLLRIGLKGYEVPDKDRLPANLVFLVDTSGSMGSTKKLPLVKVLLRELVDQLRPDDTLAIVTYSTTVTTLLPPTAVTQKSPILAAIATLKASGSTAGGPGLITAYQVAEGAKKPDGINRVVLCTDGDFNVGLSGQALIDKVIQYRDQKGVTLSVFGFGMGNYKDNLLEQLADNGNGNYGYIDSADEAVKVATTKLVGTLQMIAKDVKVQVVFDAATVASYRLLGYENRLLEKQDFKDDTKDAGEIGAGHTVTALYELKLQPTAPTQGKIATVKLRFKAPKSDTSREFERSVDISEAAASFDLASEDFRFAAAVAELAETLRDSKHCSGDRLTDVAAVAGATAQQNPERLELVQLIGDVQALRSAAP